MKKKSLFRKALSLICCVAMCLTTFIPVIDAATGVEPTVKMQMPSDELYDSDLNLIQNNGSTEAYSYSVVEDFVTFSAPSGGAFLGKTSSIMFYARAELKPTVETISSIRCPVMVNNEPETDNGETYWPITVTVKSNASGEYTLTYKKGVQTYDVTFTNGTDYTFMNAEGTATLKSGTFDDGEKISFTLNGVAEGKTAVIRENSRDLVAGAERSNLTYDEASKKYTYTVTKDATISAVLKDVTYKVTVPTTQSGYTLVSADGK